MGALLGGVAVTAVAASVSAPVQLAGSAPPERPGAAPLAMTPSAAPIEFDVSLRLPEPAAAATLERAVSDPSSPSYRHFLTPAEWEQRFSPAPASVLAVKAWLASQGIDVEGASADRMTVHARAPASIVERAFATTLSEYDVDGQRVRLAAGPLSVPASLAAIIGAVSGVDQRLAHPELPHQRGRAPGEGSAAGGGGATSEADALTSPASKPIPPGEWPRIAPPCSSYWGEKQNSERPPFGGGYPAALPYAACGYKPTQLQSAYDLSGPIAAGDDGSGVTVAVVDAYESPTLFADAHEYSVRNEPSAVLTRRLFKEDVSPTFNKESTCEANGWSVEQTLDVESVHSTAPGATILYAGAKNCENALYDVDEQLVDEHSASIITNSWGELGEDDTTPSSSEEAFNNVLLMAAGTGVGVQFSAGDQGDEFNLLGFDAVGFPATSPYATGVGGTSLEISKGGTRSAEYGWSSSFSVLCTHTVEVNEELVERTLLLEQPLNCEEARFGKWVPRAPGQYWAGGGGATTFQYPEPYYQEGVVPKALANRDKAVTHEANRVVPDISMDADPWMGLDLGETLAWPDGDYYEEVPIGGTSLSSPLLAGELAVADQAAGGALGFVNPLLYRLDASPKASSAFYDVAPPPSKQAFSLVQYVNGANTEAGTFKATGTVNYEGKEAYCPEPGACVEQKVALKDGPGYDSMTGIGAPGSQFVQDLAAP
ncbi:MAG TPA: S53 family peptidase [Solirubrobacteraceae bacterium]|nr:S53 family peptidase [Solirubrobacteraceae bacterium]